MLENVADDRECSRRSDNIEPTHANPSTPSPSEVGDTAETSPSHGNPVTPNLSTITDLEGASHVDLNPKAAPFIPGMTLISSAILCSEGMKSDKD